MQTVQPHTYMRRLYLFWERADAVLAKRGYPPLTYEEAKAWFDSETEPDEIPIGGAAPVANQLSQGQE